MTHLSRQNPNDAHPTRRHREFFRFRITRAWGLSIALVIAAFFVGRVGAQPIVPDGSLTPDEEASRFLAQATFGPSPDAIAELRGLNNDFNAWIDREAAKPQTRALPLITNARSSGQISEYNNAMNRRARNEVMISGNDQLRQRMANALSQIFVVSENLETVASSPALTDYYDMLASHSLGSFRQLLLEVTTHPVMGRFLTHYQNRKANAATGTRPDENYAREVMQLFTIGLYHLNPDGSYRLGSDGRLQDTYSNEQITEFARVFTGLTDEDNNPNASGSGANGVDFPRAARNLSAPMKMWEAQHDTGSKTLLNYSGARKPSLPAGQSGMQDINDAIDNLFEHPNTGPFISRQLIQRLVTSNPSNAYVGRVAAAFANNGRGQRGDLLAVAKAILLDPEARNLSFIADPEHGKLREPFLRVTHLLRAFRYKVSGGVLPFDFGSTINASVLGQFPLAAPSVFNFYAPDHSPPGPLTNAGLVGPEFQILTSLYGITSTNALYVLIHSSAGNFSLNVAPQAALADNPEALLDNVSLLLTHGTLSSATRSRILNAINSVTPDMVSAGNTLNATRARLAIYLVAISPDYAVLK